jgi:hypothetical protein
MEESNQKKKQKIDEENITLEYQSLENALATNWGSIKSAPRLFFGLQGKKIIPLEL